MLRKFFVAAAALWAMAGVATAQLAYAPVANDGSTGTIVGKLAKFTSAGAAITLLTSDTTWTGLVVGETVSTASPALTGNAILAIHGPASCIFDGTTVIGHYVTISSSVAGDCADTGAATYPTSGAVVGIVMAVNGGAGTTASIYLIPPGGIAPTGVTAGAYTSSNITVGADGRLTAAANGSGGASALGPAKIVGNWYRLFGPTANIGGTAFPSTTDTVCSVGLADQTFTISSLGVTITGTGSSNIQLAIYASGATTGLPAGAALGSTANIANNTTGPVSGTITSLQLLAGHVYWLCEQSNDTTVTTASFAFATGGSSNAAAYFGSATQSFITGPNNLTSMIAGGLYTTGTTFGTWPNFTGHTWSADVTNNYFSPVVAVLVASVP